ncbi:lutropin subunit beta-like [Lathamus discolor]|uniref:lutropin subunit beta-like n=1 Tax=Lathamus discolor TaxID=678569 RepID=UPI0032B7E07C
MGGPQVLVLVLLTGTPIALGTPIAIGSPIALEGPLLVGDPMGRGAAAERPLCRPINVTVALEKDECPQCRAVTTTACGGYCRTREPVYRSPLGSPPQAACTYQGLRYERWLLGGCPPGIDASVPVPVALGCRCGRCPMAAADCTVQGLGPAFCGAPAGFGPP